MYKSPSGMEDLKNTSFITAPLSLIICPLFSTNPEDVLCKYSEPRFFKTSPFSAKLVGMACKVYKKTNK